MQIERLIQMIFYLIHHGHVTAKELADYFDVSTRTVYRDINTLTLAGIPILSSKGTGGGISLVEGYTLDKSLLSKEEQQHIYHGLQTLQATKYPNTEMALSKIGAIFRSALEPKWLEIDLTYWGSEEKEKIKISELQYAIINKQVITFDYFNTYLQKSKKIIEPLRLVFKSHAWYIAGYCRDREEIRFFRMSRIRNLEVINETFLRELPQEESLITQCEEIKVDIPFLKLQFSPEIAYKLYDNFHESQVTLCEDGSYLISVQYELNDWTFHYLLSFGKHVEIIEPEIAREMMKERVKEIQKLYDK